MVFQIETLKEREPSMSNPCSPGHALMSFFRGLLPPFSTGLAPIELWMGVRVDSNRIIWTMKILAIAIVVWFSPLAASQSLSDGESDLFPLIDQSTAFVTGPIGSSSTQSYDSSSSGTGGAVFVQGTTAASTSLSASGTTATATTTTSSPSNGGAVFVQGGVGVTSPNLVTTTTTTTSPTGTTTTISSGSGVGAVN